MISLDQLRLQVIARCKERIEAGEKRIQPVTLPRMKARYGL